MVLDTSALLAILQGEPGGGDLIEAIAAAESRLLSVASFVEASIVIESRFGAEGLRDLDHFLEVAGVRLVEVDTEQGRLARRAFSRFGRGRHPAGLNFGDCFVYALAAARSQSLLFVGEDFARTDLTAFAAE